MILIQSYSSQRSNAHAVVSTGIRVWHTPVWLTVAVQCERSGTEVAPLVGIVARYGCDRLSDAVGSMGCGASSGAASAGKYEPVPPDASMQDVSPTKQIEDRPRPGAVKAQPVVESERAAMDERLNKLEHENAILRRQLEAFVEERKELTAAAATKAPSPPDAVAPVRGGARVRAAGVDTWSVPSNSTEIENRLVALENLAKQQHIVWVDKVRPSLAWIIDRMQEVHVRVGAEGGSAPPPRTPIIATPQRQQSMDASMVSALSGTVRASVIASAYGADINMKRQAEVENAVRRLRDACKTYTASDWKPKLKRYAMPAGPRADEQIPLAEFARALRRAVADENKLTYEVGDCEIVHQAVDYDKTGIVGLEEMAAFLEGPGMGEQNLAAAKIQSVHRGKRARRRVSAKMARSLANHVRIDEGLGQSKDEKWQQMADMPPATLLELIFNQIDNNRSGKITRRELRYSDFSSFFRDKWKAMNSNEDKAVDMTEWEEFWGDMFYELGAEKYAETVVNMAWQGHLRLPEETGDPAYAPKRRYNAPGVPEKLVPKKVSTAEPEAHHAAAKTQSPKKKKKVGRKKKK